LREKTYRPVGVGLGDCHDNDRCRRCRAHPGVGMHTDDFVKRFPLCDRDKFPGARVTRGGRMHCRREQLVKLPACDRGVFEPPDTLPSFNQRVQSYQPMRVPSIRLKPCPLKQPAKVWSRRATSRSNSKTLRFRPSPKRCFQVDSW